MSPRSEKQAAGTINLNLRTEAPAKNEDDEKIDTPRGPFFSELVDEDGSRHTRTRIYRVKPIEEGRVGDLEPSATEEDIRERWGGGTFDCQAVNERGVTMRRGRVTIKLAGDPKIDSILGRRLYKQWLEQQFPEEDAKGKTESHAPPAERPMSAIDMMLFIQKQSEVVRAEARELAEQRRRDDEAAHQRHLEELREESRRKQTETEERERSRTKESEERAERDRQFLATQHAMTLQLVQAMSTGRADDGSAVKTLIAGMEIAGKMMGGGGNDPLAAAIENIPEILRATVETVGAVRSERGGAPARNPRPRGSARVASENRITFDGEIGAKYARVYTELKDAGHDPEEVLTQAADAILRAKVRKADKAETEAKPDKPADDKAKRKKS